MLSVLQILKSGVNSKKPKVETIAKRKNSSEKFEQYNLQKFNPDDSESEVNQEIDFRRNRRKESLDNLETEMSKRQQQKIEKRNTLLKKYRIKISEYFPLMTNFTKMMKAIDRELIVNIKKAGYSKPTPIQMAAIPAILAGKSVIAIAPTGSGKTAAFAIPLIQKLGSHQDGGARCLILSPSMELGSQLFQEITQFGSHSDLRIKFMQTMNRDALAFKQQWSHLDILVSTPLKFLKLHQKVDLSTIEYLVMDESDKYFELGMTKQIQQLLRIFEQYNKVNYLLFSATLAEPIEEIFRELIVDPVKIQVGGRNHVLKSINQQLQYCSNEFGKMYEIKNIINEGRLTPPVLIFVQSKQRAEALLLEFTSLKSQTQIRVECIHGCMQSDLRQSIVDQFHQGTIWVLICTDLMARGIDFKGVKLIINYDFPNSMITYVHRVGRTGRAGTPGTAITFFTDEDKPMLRTLANMLKVSGCEVPEWIFNLKAASRQQKKINQKFPVRREAIEDATPYRNQ